MKSVNWSLVYWVGRKFVVMTIGVLLAVVVGGCAHYGSHHYGDSDVKCSSCKGGHEGEAHHAVNEHATRAKVETGKFADVPYHFRSKTFFTGALNEEALEDAKKLGVTTIINLQNEKELKFSEKESAEKLGLKYYSVPVDAKNAKYDLTVFSEIEKYYMKHHRAGEKVLVHCGSGARVAAWFAYHLHVTHKDTLDNAILGAKDIGLTEPLEKKVRSSF